MCEGLLRCRMCRFMYSTRGLMRSGLCRYLSGINEMQAVRGYWGDIYGDISRRYCFKRD